LHKVSEEPLDVAER